jgi:hypothetical protein
MVAPLIGRSHEFMRTMADKTKRQVLRKILRNVQDGIPLESACWAADVDPDIFGEWMKAEPRVRNAVMREYAVLERTLVRQVREGGRGMSAAKAALEVLERQFKTWARKTNVTLANQMNDVLEELERLLPAEHYETVLKVLSKHE